MQEIHVLLIRALRRRVRGFGVLWPVIYKAHRDAAWSVVGAGCGCGMVVKFVLTGRKAPIEPGIIFDIIPIASVAGAGIAQQPG